MNSRDMILDVIKAERERQLLKWGNQKHPDGTNLAGDVDQAFLAKAICDRESANGTLTWRNILNEEVREAFAEDDGIPLEDELIQVAAVAVAWIEDIRRRRMAELSAFGQEIQPDEIAETD